ncbi:MAG TPA: C25 family cysteine peptidase [Bacteroidales bacterium]|nr:C25 family cysteine peptidase [Bacteroidales bacterium]
MKKLFALWILIHLCSYSFAQNWVNINSATPVAAKVSLTSADIVNSSFNVDIKGYFSHDITTPHGQKTILSLDNTTPILEAGAPDLPKVTTSLIIPDDSNMEVEVTYSNYTEYQNIHIAPSKGNLTRDINPATIPYTYGPVYSQNQFFPGTLAALKEPYILRDFRGQTVIIYPFQYNPVTKTLRVYHNIGVSLHTAPGTAINPFIRTQPLSKIEKEFSSIYNSHFLNYHNNHKYTPLDEHGNMLIICADAYMNAMQPFVDWKNDEGIPTVMVSKTTAGATASAIKTYVTNYYNANGLTFLLLVGDAAQVPTFTVSGGGSDPSYGYISGNDHYQEFFVGRFSAETIEHVTTQVNRTVRYEKTPSVTPGKFNHAVNIGSDQRPGDDNEYDYQHQRNLGALMMGFTYTSRAELFDGSQSGLDASGDPSAAMLSTEVNNGAGIITYTGHGSNTAFSTTGFSNTNVNALTNTTLWPFIWSVACVNGNFVSTTCLAEAWLRATSGGQPSGAIATLMSTINQSWDPPMEGQDEMVDILTENAGTNIKRTFGGLSVNGIFKMNDTYSDYNMTDTWTIFGDPSLMVRTDDPKSMTVSHTSSVLIGETSLLVNCNVNNAFVCLTVNHQIIGTGTINGGSANITFPSLASSDSILVTVTAFNYIPYQGKVAVIEQLLTNNAQAYSIMSPAQNYNCTGLTAQPRMVIRNMGANNLTSLNTTFIFDGSPSYVTWSGNLPSFGTDTITFPGITLSSGLHNIIAYISQPNGNADVYTSNDTLKKTVTVNNLPVTSSFVADKVNSCTAPLTVQFTNNSANAVSYLWNFGDGTTSTDPNPTHQYTTLGVYDVTLTADAGECGSAVNTETEYIVLGAIPPVLSDTSSCGPGSFVLTAGGTGIKNWYDAASGGTLLYTGNTYSTPVLNTTTTYYVEQTMLPPLEYGGKFDTTGGSSLHTNNSYWLVFNCTAPVTLKSVKVYAGAAGNRIIQLRNSAGTILQADTINVPAGESRITLNFNVPVGNNMSLRCGTTNPNMIRNSGGITFPYDIGGKISITGSNATTATRYYYFYDWEITGETCVSSRAPVTAYINTAAPSADFSFTVNNSTVDFTDLSTNATTYSWDFGDGNTSILANPTHTYAASGSYTVQLTVNNGCGTNTVSKNVVINATAVIEESSIENVNIFPNPASAHTVFFSFEYLYEPVTITIFDILGNSIDKIEHINHSNDPVTITYDIDHLQSGMYFVVFNNKNKNLIKKLAINK